MSKSAAGFKCGACGADIVACIDNNSPGPTRLECEHCGWAGSSSLQLPVPVDVDPDSDPCKQDNDLKIDKLFGQFPRKGPVEI